MAIKHNGLAQMAIGTILAHGGGVTATVKAKISQCAAHLEIDNQLRLKGLGSRAMTRAKQQYGQDSES